MVSNNERMLSPYRVLDLTDEKGMLCGKILGDLGADVIKVERPGGDASRAIGPFYKDEPDPEKSLYWFAYNSSKRGITLDIGTADGREMFLELVKTADIVVESFPPGFMEKIGLGYADLEKVKKDIIMVSVSPFGQTGPYRDWKAPDLVAWAMGGYMYSVGDADRPPVRISHHFQSYLHAGGQAANGALMALFHREATGEGQYVDVSIQDSATRCTPERVTMFWDFNKRIVTRGPRKGALQRIWKCKDGYVYAMFWSGPMARRWNAPLVNWMIDRGVATDFIKEFEWETFNMNVAPMEVLEQLAGPMRELFAGMTKKEIFRGAMDFNAQVYPANTTEDIMENVQLESREYFVEMEHPELEAKITYPGPFAKTTEAPPEITRRAPLIGEHNLEIYEQEMGISRQKIQILKQANVI